MISNRLFVVASVCALPLSFAACGGDDGGEPRIVPEGDHHGYVISKVTAAPEGNDLPTSIGLDLGSKTSAELDGKIDNKLGQVFGLLGTATLDVNAMLGDAINAGSIILLIDLQTKDFTTSNAAGLSVKFGENPAPAACDANMVCGGHLKGSASFSVAANSPTDAALAGKIENGTFNSQAGDVTLQIALGTSGPVELNLLHARVKASGISDTGIMTAIVGGLLTVDDLTTKVAPAIKVQVDAVMAASCTGGPPLDCGCTGTGPLLIARDIDGSDGTAPDCVITVPEILNYPIVKTVLQPDSCSQETCKAPDALSIGVKIEAVKATFK